MAISDGAKVTYHSEHGDVPAWVVEYEAGRDAGDHRIGGFCNTKQKQAGGGDTFNVWSTPGSKQGEFTPK